MREEVIGMLASEKRAMNKIILKQISDTNKARMGTGESGIKMLTRKDLSSKGKNKRK